MSAAPSIVDGATYARAARRWLRTPWQHQGRVRGLGTDCVGLPAGLGLELELLRPEDVPRLYHRRGQSEEFLRAVGRALVRQPKGTAPRAGLVAAFYLRQQGHLGVLLRSEFGPWLSMLHADASSGVKRVTEVTFDERWRAALLALFDWPLGSVAIEAEA